MSDLNAALSDSSLQDTEHASLVEEVKKWKRAFRATYEAWVKFCVDHGDGNPDPGRYDIETLQDAVAMLRAKAESVGAEPDLEQTHLACKLTEWQKRRRKNSQAWIEYCDKDGNGW